MHNFSRQKRVTDPFDDEAKARIFGRFEPGSVSSGSEHSAHKFDDDDVASPSLSDLFCGVLLDSESGMSAEPTGNDSGRDTESLKHDSAAPINELKLIFGRDRDADSFKDVLRSTVVRFMGMFASLEKNKSILRRNVMSSLRNSGYNAGICKTKWEGCGGLNAGNYEFIDVIRSDVNSTRFLIDLDFRSEFELARPTMSYEELLNALPRVFIGEAEELKQVLRIVGEGARRSLKSAGLHVPPWRKHRFMRQKWFGPYKRTVNVFPETFAVNKKVTVKCRAVGFDDNGNGVNGRFFAAATRTR